MGNSSLVPFESQPPSRSQSRSPAPYTGGTPAPLHTPGEMALQSGNPLRHDCWNMLSPGVRAKMSERTGPAIGWWAETFSTAESRPGAVVLGDRGLAIAEPRVNAEHQPVYSVATYLIDPSSFQHQQIEHRPERFHGRRRGNPSDPPPVHSIKGLGSAASRLLGNLPPRAQELLQSPFLDGAELTRCDWHYEGHENHLRMFMIYLAGPDVVTAALGSTIVPAGHSQATAHWSLACLRATVTRRIGR